MGNEPQNFIPAFADQEGPQPGPSWEKRGWLDALSDSASDLVAAMDPTEMKLAVAKAAKDAGRASDPKAVEKAAALSIENIAAKNLAMVPLLYAHVAIPALIAFWFMMSGAGARVRTRAGSTA